MSTILSSFLTFAHSAFFLVLGVVGVGFLIGFHELGHYLFCKLFSIRTPSFSIGMGPRLISKKIGKTEFSLSAIPLGGYVEIAGAAEVGQGEQTEAYATDSGSFAQKPYYQKLLVMLGGIFFNLVFAYAALTALFYMGMERSPLIVPGATTTTIGAVEPNSSAQKAGLQTGDTIISIDQKDFQNKPAELIEYIQKNPDKEITIAYKRKGSIENTSANLTSRAVGQKNLGVLGTEFSITPLPLLLALQYGIKTTHSMAGQVINAFKTIFVSRDTNNVGGPLMVISQTIQGAKRGLKIFLFLLAFISVNLAVLNLIPLPILDGGQLLFYTIEALFARPLPTKVREYIHIASWLGVLALMLYLSFKDIMRIFFIG